MDIKRLETISFAEGFIEDFLEQWLEEIDEETAQPQTLEQAKQVKNMWIVLTAGLKELRQENSRLQTKIHAAQLTLS